MTFLYNPLNDQEIRLVTIHPNKDQEAIIQCSLQTASLTKQPKFEALSYVWGSGSSTESIYLEGDEFQVTPNLGSALRLLRQPTSKRVMWIDYICINQQDTLEKNKQVPLMGSIYMKASRVVAMLGESSPEIEMAVSWCERYIHKRVNRRTLYWWKLAVKSRFSVEARRERDIALMKTFIGLRQFLILPYWTRMWTFQEYHLPRREPICMCGGFTFNASTLVGTSWAKAVTTAFDHMGKKEPSTVDVLERNTPSPSQDEKTRAHCLEMERLGLIYCEEYAFATEWLAYLDIVRDQKVHESRLWHQLHMVNRRQCGDPRDRVYALYALVPGIQKAYPPDYNKPLEQVLLETTQYIIKEEAGANIFDLFVMRRDHLSDSVLPSWVPDYTKLSVDAAGSPYHIVMGMKKVLYDHREEYFPSVSSDLKTLHIWARRVGRCKPIFQLGSDWREIVTQIMGVFNMIDEWGTVWNPSTVCERFIRALLCHENRKEDFSMQHTIAMIRRVALALESGEEDTVQEIIESNTETEDLFSRELAMNCGHSVFLVCNFEVSGFGICPVLVEDGDVAVVENTARHPLVLRQYDQSYKVLGQAYIDGLAETPETVENPLCAVVEKEPHQGFLVI